MSTATKPAAAVDATTEAPCCAPATAAPLGDAEASALAETYRALADPVRLKLLSMVVAAGEVCSCDLVEPLAKSQPTVSHHTKLLADAGLIVGRRRGRWVWWSVVPEQADFVARALGV